MLPDFFRKLKKNVTCTLIYQQLLKRKFHDKETRCDYSCGRICAGG